MRKAAAERTLPPRLEASFYLRPRLHKTPSKTLAATPFATSTGRPRRTPLESPAPMAMHRAAALALRSLAAAAAAASPSPTLLLAPLRPPPAVATNPRFLLQPAMAAAALCGRRGYAARGGAGRKAARAVSESEEDEDEEFEVMRSDGEFDDDLDDEEDLDEFDDEDEE